MELTPLALDATTQTRFAVVAEISRRVPQSCREQPQQFCQDDYTRRGQPTSHWLTRLAAPSLNRHTRSHLKRISSRQTGQIASTTRLKNRLSSIYELESDFKDHHHNNNNNYYYNCYVRLPAAPFHLLNFTRFQKYHYVKSIRTKYKRARSR